MEWSSVYRQFPVNERAIWLNNCGTVPAGVHALEAVTRYLEGYAREGVFTRTAVYKEVKERIQTILAGLLHCRPDELALIHNTAEGMNFISHGLSLSAGDEIILLENEYPSNVYPWLHWKEKGVIIRTAPAGENPEAFFQGLARLVSRRTRVAAVSIVHWCTGMPLPLERIGALCRENDIELVVDGAQGVGMIPVDIQSAGISYMAFPAWKWLTGPLGLGVLYADREKLEKLKPIFIGTSSVVRDLEYLPYKSELKPNADRFIVSTPNFTDWVYFQACLEFLRQIGFDRVQKRIHALSGRLSEGLRNIGCRLTSDAFPDHSSGIVVFERPGMRGDEMVAALGNQGVIAAERLGRVRLSPHVYLSPEQIDRTVKLVDKLGGAR